MKNYILILCASLILYGCKAQQEYTANELKTLVSTHNVTDPVILEAVNIFALGKEIEDGEFIDVYISTGGNSANCYEIQLSISNFELEKDYRAFMGNKTLENHKVKGYLNYNNNFLVLRGDITNFFACISPCNVRSIFKRREPFNGILPIYEPSIFKYEICNRTIVYKGIID